MVNYIKGLKFDPIQQSGRTSFRVDNIRVSSFDVDDISLRAVGNGLRASITGVSGRLDANYWIKQRVWFFYISNSGRLSATFSRVSVSATVTLTPSGEIKVMSCVPNVGYVKARVSGSGWDWILNIIISLFDGQIQREIRDAMCPALTQDITSQSAKIKAEMKKLAMHG